MKVTLLGTGTSQGIPVIACNCEVCKSHDLRDNRLRTSVMIEDKSSTVVIDSGPDFRYQMLRAGVQKLDAIVFTHEHKDHLAGLDDIRAFNFVHEKEIDVYATERVQGAIKQEFAYIFKDKKYPGIPQVNLKTIHESAFAIGDLIFQPIEVMHYQLPVLGFRIGDFTYITDANFITEKEKEKIKGSKVLILNALRRESHVSHFTLEQAVALAQEINADMTYFIHMSHQMGLHRDVEMELPPNIRLAYDGLVIEM